MSKLLPKIKKKLKGKDDDVLHEAKKKTKEEEAGKEAKKKRGKTIKAHKDDPATGTPVATSKHDKKKKAGKHKAQNEKDIHSLVYEKDRSKEFFVDDSGTIRESSAGLYVDKNGSVREGPGEQFTDLTLEDDRRHSHSSVKMVDILEASYKDLDSEDALKRGDYSTLDFNVDGFRIESPTEGLSVSSRDVSFEEENYYSRGESSLDHTKDKNLKNPAEGLSVSSRDLSYEEENGYSRDGSNTEHTENKFPGDDSEIDNLKPDTSTPDGLVLDSESISSPLKAEDILESDEAKVGQGEQGLMREQEERTVEGQQYIPVYLHSQSFSGDHLNISKNNYEETGLLNNDNITQSSEIKEETSTGLLTSREDEAGEENNKSRENIKCEGEEEKRDKTETEDKGAYVGEDKQNEVEEKVGNDAEESLIKSESGVEQNGDEVILASDQQGREELSSPTSLDSDDDFDSAQEDWDEDDQGKDNSRSSINLGESEALDGEAVEATNTDLLSERSRDDRGLSSTSSIYQDAVISRENSQTLDISSLAESINEDFGEDLSEAFEEGKVASQPAKLTRKISNISGCSSDVFDEELDELLDEELDRLSEEEEAVSGQVTESTDEGTQLLSNHTAALDSGGELVHDSAIVEKSSQIKGEEITQEECDNVIPKQEGSIEISDISVASADANDKITRSPEHLSSEQSLIDKDNASVPVSAPDSDKKDLTSPEKETTDIPPVVVDNMRSPEEESKIGDEETITSDKRETEGNKSKSSSLLTPEDVPEETKDSGYYSLPVSPAVARGTEPSSSETTNPNDSLGESEEEGMITPPCQVPPDIPYSNTTQEAESPFNTSTPEVTEEPSDGCVTPTEAVDLPLDVSETLAKVTTDSMNVSEVPSEIIATVSGDAIFPAKDGSSSSEFKDTPEQLARGKEELPTSKEKAESIVESEKGRKTSESSPVDGESRRPKLTMPKQPIVTNDDVRDGIGSPRSGSSTPTLRPSRHHKNSVTSGGDLRDEVKNSPDPVGDKFLQQAVAFSHQEAEARLAQRRAARAEARELRLRELEKQQHEQDNDEDKPPSTSSTPQPYTDCGVARAGSGRMSGVSRVAGVNSVAGGQYSRRSSEDSTTDEALPANVREMRADLKELDEKFRKAMITNAQLDNEKATLTFEVELMKDRYTELEETHTQLTKEHRKKCTEYEQLRKVSTKLQEEVKILRGLLQERDQLIQEYGLVVVGEEETEENGEPVVSAADQEEDDVEDLSPRKILVKKALVSQEAADLLSKGSARGSLDVRLKKFGEEKNDLEDQVRRLKLELEEERCSSRRRENGLDYEKQKEQSKTVNEYKFRVQKAEAEVSTLQANVARLDALSTRYKTQSDELERSEEELKLEKRKLQRELRDAQSRLEELETTNNHLIKRFDKLKNARSNLLKDLSQDPA